MAATWLSAVVHPVRTRRRSRLAAALAEITRLRAEVADLRAANWGLRDEQTLMSAAEERGRRRGWQEASERVAQLTAAQAGLSASLRAELAAIAGLPTQRLGDRR